MPRIQAEEDPNEDVEVEFVRGRQPFKKGELRTFPRNRAQIMVGEGFVRIVGPAPKPETTDRMNRGRGDVQK